MTLLLKLAWRSLWRHRRRTLITLSSIVMSLAIALYFITLADGMYGQMLHGVLRMQAGHITVENPEYVDAPAIDLLVPRETSLRERIEKLDGVESTKAVVLGQGIASTGAGTVGVAIAGVEPAVEASMSPLVRRIEDGQYLNGDPRSVVVGAELARRLELAVGNKLVLSGNDRSGQLTQEMVRVCGVFSTGALEMDGHYVQVPIDFARRLYGVDRDEATQVGVVLDDPHRQAELLATVTPLAADQGAVALPWQQVLPELSTFMRIDKGANYVFQVLIVVMAMFTIFNTLLMSVLERKREFAVMLAVGTAPARVKAQVFMEAAIMGLVGVVIGLSLGALAAWATDGYDLTAYMPDGLDVGGFLVEPRLYMKVAPETLGWLGGGSLAAILAMTVVPVLRIDSIKVTEAFR
jgi:ABC-type lipoprotein release transport system permease subunit